MASQDAVDPRSAFVFDTRDLGRRVGAMLEHRRQAPAPADFGTEVIGVPQGSPVDLELRLEEVGEGVLVTGTATSQVRGVCGRCLTEIDDRSVIDLQELFVHPEYGGGDDEGTSHLVNELLDLEPLLRDQVVLDLPFQPVCREDCAGLCAECGVNLNDDPDHGHDEPIDPRWAGLAELSTDLTDRNHESQQREN
ncbi:MAG TPA: DUF177 domain-containing protein [Candidatus Avipropionibacterium avicola]|uniref:DUF177 domain-containing protein n=1 Tax=Candidatus Avipropionibacterium avicola TaxID=2840701 RepID=A0A9D1GX03_9ACTN|nr:DUF177 domain-containing protein [Candidatus Avipropionibacterium avicola]